METKKKKSIVRLVIVLALVAVVCIVFHFLTGRIFLTSNNILALFPHAIIPCFLGWALCFVFACDFTDMSLGPIVILAANAAGILGSTSLGYFGIILGAMVVSIICVMINFLLFAKSRIPSWIVSIGMVMVYEAVGVFYSNYQFSHGGSLAQLSEDMRELARAPMIYVVFFVGFILAYVLYNYTTIGLKVRSLGSGQRISEAMGINIVKTILLVGIIVGIFVGCSAFLNESYNSRMNIKSGLTGMTMIFQPIAAVMLAQVLKSRINIIIGVPICSLFVYALFNMLTIAGVPSGTLQEAVLGLIVIVFGIMAQRGVKKVVK